MQGRRPGGHSTAEVQLKSPALALLVGMPGELPVRAFVLASAAFRRPSCLTNFMAGATFGNALHRALFA